MEKYYRNIGFYFLVLIIFIGLGFYYPYFSLFPDFISVSAMVHVHTLTLMLWTLILITQPLLIRYEKYQAHKFLGRFTYFLVPLVVMTCAGVMHQQYHEYIARGISPAQSLKVLFTPITDLLAIICYYLLAIVNIRKGNIAYHMRYMICLFLEFLPPTFGRTMGYWLNWGIFYTHVIAVATGAIIIITLLVADKKRNLDFTPYAVALGIYALINGAWFAIGHPI